MVALHIVIATLIALACAAQPPSADEKSSRTSAQRKIDSQLLYEIYRARGEAEQKRVPPGDTGIRIDARRRVLVDVRAPVTATLQAVIRRLGGAVLTTSPAHQSTIARIPLLKIEALAADSSVQFIAPAAEATTVRDPS